MKSFIFLIVLRTVVSFSLISKKSLKFFLWSQNGDEKTSDLVWKSAADKLVSGSGAGEIFVKESILKIESEVMALKSKEYAQNMRNNEVMKSRAESARQAISSLSSDDMADGRIDRKQEFSQKKNEKAHPYSNVAPQISREPSNLPLPFMEADTIGIVGKWKEKHGNFVIKPDEESTYNQGNDKGVLNPPLGVIHFLGGAFVGAAPHLTYRYMLEGLVDAGYIVVATPYHLDFDYVEICDSILRKFDRVAVELAQEFGAVPVVGLGHSCGALLQTLITSLFPDAPRAANVLISFNNRPAKEAIPGFEELVVPFSNAVVGDQARSLRSAATDARDRFDKLVNRYASSSLSPKFVGTELVPLLNQGLKVLDQVPDILSSIARGRREFEPSPADTKEACRRMYRARSTLLIKFDDDDLDESVEVETILKEANTIMRMKRPMVEMNVQLQVIKGTHLTPLSQTFMPGPPEGMDDTLEPLRTALQAIPPLRQASEVRSAVLKFLSDQIINKQK